MHLRNFEQFSKKMPVVHWHYKKGNQMKIKSDFVTNSSSSSFVVMGTRNVSVDLLDPKKYLEKYPNDGLTEEDVREDMMEYIDDYLEHTSLTHSFGSCYDIGNLMVGIEYTEMKEDETLGEFKERVKKEIKDVFGVDVEVSHTEECWMDY